MTTETSLIVNLPQMIDLALGSPELGAVNFNVLHALLHVMIQRVKLTECTVEFRGADSERVHALISRAKPGPSLRLTEYHVAGDTSKRKSSAVEKEIGVISPRKDSKQVPKSASPFAVPQKGEGSTIILVERSSQLNLPKLTVAVSESRFTDLENNVQKLKQNMTEILEMPKNSSLMEALRNQSTDKQTPVVDMWQILNLNKRLDAAEAGVNKLASMVEDLMRDTVGELRHGLEPSDTTDTNENAQTEEQKRSSGRGSIFLDITNRLNAVEEKLSEMGSKARSKASVKPVGSSDKPGLDEDDVLAITTDLETLRKTIKSVESDFSTLTKGFKGKKLVDLVKDIEELKDLTKKMTKDEGAEDEKGASSSQMIELQGQILELTQKLNNLDESVNTHINTLEESLFGIEKEFGSVVERVNTAISAEQADASTSVSEIYNRVLKLQDELEKVGKTIDSIVEEKDERQLAMDALVEQIQLLKTIKADREDLEDALADKADRQLMNRKVSHDQFDAACGDLNRGIEETMTRLQQQEGVWHSALDELQITVGTKIDKLEFDPLKDFVDKKIHLLQQRIKALMALKEEQEAAGVKSKVLRDVNCLSCDKDVVIHKQNKFPTIPAPPPLSGNLSMKPYITYELDAVRKQQRLIPKGRNLNLLESALQEAKAKEKMHDKAIPPTTHLCNRYCGGSHTITTPQQRVAHIGHFINQWGPQVINLDDKIKAAKEGIESPRISSESDQKKLSRPSALKQSKTSKMQTTRLSKIVEISEEGESPKEEDKEKAPDEETEAGGRRKSSKSVRLSQVRKGSRDETTSDDGRKSLQRKSGKSITDQSKASLARASGRELRASQKRTSSKLTTSKGELSEETRIAHDELEEILGHAEKLMAERSSARVQHEEISEAISEPATEPMSEPETDFVSEPVSEPVTTDEEAGDVPPEPEPAAE